MSKETIVDLIRARPTTEEWAAAWKEVRDGTDRSAAILAAAYTEDMLRFSISMRFWDVDDKYFDKMCKPPGPLSSFSSMIQLGYALGIYREVFRDDLDVIRTIRNVFAHAMKPISFKTLQVIGEIEKFKYLKSLLSLPLEEPDEIHTPGIHFFIRSGNIPTVTHREKYVATCQVITNDILDFGSNYATNAKKPLLP